ncbi:MAG: LptF/LptG family permease [bacterium]
MRILDWYILRRFCIILIYALLLFIFIVIFVDMVGNLGKFIDRNVPKIIILKYYVFYTPFIVFLVLPISMLLASLFSIGHITRYNELTAIKSVGISLYRILGPILGFGFFVSFLALGFGEMIVPAANQGKRNIENDYLEIARKRNPTKASNIFWRDKLNRRIFIGHYDNRNKTAQKVTIQTYIGNQIVERLDAPRMKWQDSTWVLQNGYKRKFSHGKEEAIAFDILPQANIDIKPEQLVQSQVQPEDMSFSELKIFTNEVKANGGNPDRWLVDLYFKISIPFANFIMVLFGAPLASNKKRSGAIFGFIISLFVCFIYYGSNKLIQTLGQNGHLSPLFAAWFTNGIFFTTGLLLLFITRK